MACCQVLGVKVFDLQQTKPAALKEQVFQKCKKNIDKYLFPGTNSMEVEAPTKCFLMGNAIATTDFNEAKETLIQRDYPQMNQEKVGQIFVPQEFMSKMPRIVSYSDFHNKIELQKEAGLPTTNEINQ